MQSGRAKTRVWLMEFEPGAAKTVDRLIGWVGSRDMRFDEVRLLFPSRDEAVAFAEKHGFDYEVCAARERLVKPKNYADNFRPDRTGNWTH
jgi:hypothetical protein